MAEQGRLIVKIARLAVLAFLVVLVLGLVGVSSASAVTLCKTNVAAECLPGEGYAVGTEVQASQTAKTKFQLIGVTEEFPGVECKQSNIQFKTTENRGKEKILVATFTVLNATECTGCESVSAVNLPYTDEITWSKMVQGNGFMSISSGGKGNVRLSLKKCGPMSIDCTFGTAGMLLAVTGGAPATIFNINEILGREAGNLLCGTFAELTTTYSVTNLLTLYVEKGP
jgi:hypothetical protein